MLHWFLWVDRLTQRTTNSQSWNNSSQTACQARNLSWYSDNLYYAFRKNPPWCSSLWNIWSKLWRITRGIYSSTLSTICRKSEPRSQWNFLFPGYSKANCCLFLFVWQPLHTVIINADLTLDFGVTSNLWGNFQKEWLQIQHNQPFMQFFVRSLNARAVWRWPVEAFYFGEPFKLHSRLMVV